MDTSTLHCVCQWHLEQLAFWNKACIQWSIIKGNWIPLHLFLGLCGLKSSVRKLYWYYLALCFTLFRQACLFFLTLDSKAKGFPAMTSFWWNSSLSAASCFLASDEKILYGYEITYINSDLPMHSRACSSKCLFTGCTDSPQWAFRGSTHLSKHLAQHCGKQGH